MSPQLSDDGNLCHTCARIWRVDLQKPEVLPVMRIDYHCSENIVVGYCFCGGLRWASDGLPKIGHVCLCYPTRQGYINPL